MVAQDRWLSIYGYGVRTLCPGSEVTVLVIDNRRDDNSTIIGKYRITQSSELILGDRDLDNIISTVIEVRCNGR